jgi:uncharacterized membrane protein
VLRTIVFTVLTLSYPLAVWLLGDRVSPRVFAGVLVLIGALRLYGARRHVGAAGWVAFAAAAFVLAAMAGVLNEGWPLLWYPALVNAVFLSTFLFTLVRPPSMAERIARITEPDLPAFAIVYTRRVTIAWCCFFVVNGVLAALTAGFGSEKVWALYNGAIAYVLIGMMAAGEYLVRLRVKARHAHG